MKWYLIHEIRIRERPVLAVDIGGTKISMALISSQGEMLGRQTLPTLASEGLNAVIDRLLSGIDSFLTENTLMPSSLNAISLATAGIIDTRMGLVTDSPNLPGWHNVPLRNIVTERYKTATLLLNDADAAALGEHRFGAGRGLNTLVLLTLGTGIGGGIIINGDLYLGPNGSAAEIGHMVIETNGPKCRCGNNGCLESLASGTAVAREAISRVQKGEKSSLAGMVEGKLDNITAETVHQAARASDSLANAIIARAASYIGTGVTNIVNIFNPEMVIIGGSMAAMGGLLLEPIRQTVNEKAFPLHAQSVHIVPAELGNDAGLFGAAAFAMEH